MHEAAPELPLLAYSIPRLTGYAYGVETLAELADEGVVHGVKESSDEIARLLHLRDACGPDFAIFAGSPTLMAAAHAHGMAGTITGLAAVAPAECAEVLRLAPRRERGARAAPAPRGHRLQPRPPARRREGVRRAALRHPAGRARPAARADGGRARARGLAAAGGRACRWPARSRSERNPRRPAGVYGT